MTLYQKPKFSVPATGEKTKTPCKVHHFVKGKCLRCPEIMRETVTVPTDAEGEE